MGRMNAKQKLHFSRHALPLTFVRNLAGQPWAAKRLRLRLPSRIAEKSARQMLDNIWTSLRQVRAAVRPEAN